MVGIRQLLAQIKGCRHAKHPLIMAYSHQPAGAGVEAPAGLSTCIADADAVVAHSIVRARDANAEAYEYV